MLTRFRLLTLLSVACAMIAEAAEPKFPLALSANRRHLVDQPGASFLYNADTAWMIFLKLTETEASDYMARRKEQGFNALQVQLTGFLGDTNRVGELPFAGTRPVQDFSQPSEKFFAHVDRVVAGARRQKLAGGRASAPTSRLKAVSTTRNSGASRSQSRLTNSTWRTAI